MLRLPAARRLTLPTLCLASLLALPWPYAVAGPDLSTQIDALVPTIGGYPPNVKTDAELKSVKKTYADLKARLDKDVKAAPGDLKLLALRGRLQTMGHNLDLKGAFEGAESDLTKVLKVEPTNVPVLIDLGSMWVNADPALAPKAEALFRAAQCATGAAPLEDAQRGLYFAFYYQGRVKDAFRQIAFLKAQWPDNATYAKLYEVTESVIRRSEPTVAVADKPVMTSCTP